MSMQVKLLLLDEPGANLDSRSRRRLIEILDARTEAMLLATHDLPMVRRLCSRVILMDQGQIVADRPVDEMLVDAALLHEHGVVD
jgi:cobalt/nickel transport system ATP-binding protein